MSIYEIQLKHDAVEHLFAERKDFIIIGLTGRTGSGCSTIAGLLAKSFDDLQPPQPPKPGNIEDREYGIVYNFSQTMWEQFKLIEMRCVIFTFMLEYDYAKFKAYVKETFFEELNADEYETEYNKLHGLRISYKAITDELNRKGENVPGGEDIAQFYFQLVPDFYRKFTRKLEKSLYTKILQQIGDNIRSSGEAFSSKIQPNNIYKLAQRANMMIKILRRRNISEKKKVLVVIDALRNPYEALYFKDRYSAFYLFSINVSDDERKRRLSEGGFRYEEILELDKREYPKRNNTIQDFYRVNIEKTVELADIHINNGDSQSKKLKRLKMQIVRYVALIMHPGLVPPTETERCMQIAFDSKLNSGCLSRQVGAVITNSEYDIISTGWNCAPTNQVPCTLRNVSSIVRDDDVDEFGTSEYEKIDKEFREYLKRAVSGVNEKDLCGRNFSFCFKDAYNAYDGKDNQVHTRSIHAEEMAFLQAAKLGGISIKGGFLFTTASPCELCSKKSYHIGIKRIYYIDQYPGISRRHVLSSGSEKPEMILFTGAIGRAYTQLYTQILPYKDELYMLLNLKYPRKKRRYKVIANRK